MEEENKPEPSWLYKRTELDLLEEDFQSLYLDTLGQDRILSEMEEEILEEQEATDREAHAHLHHLFSHDEKSTLADPIFFQESKEDEEVNTQTITEMLTSLSAADPLAHSAYAFARDIYQRTNLSHKNSALHRHLFCIRANAPLFGAKVGFAVREEEATDEFGPHIALKEYDVAIIFLERILVSLKKLSQEEVFSQSEALAFVAEGERLHNSLQAKRRRLRFLLQFRHRSQ